MCTRHALGYLPRDTCVGSRYGHKDSFPTPFSLAPGIDLTPLNEELFLLSCGSRHYGTPHVYTVKQGDGLARPTPKRRVLSLRYRMRISVVPES